MSRWISWIALSFVLIAASASTAPPAGAAAQTAPEKAGWEWDPWGLIDVLLTGDAGWELDPWG